MMKPEAEQNRIGFAATVVLIFLGLSPTAWTATKTWTGSVSTNWNDTSNWTGGTPGDTDDVDVPSGTTYSPWMPAGTNPATGRYGSFSVSNGATVVCLGNTGVVNEASGGTGGTNHGIGVTILCTHATIEGTLHANAKGFQSGGPGRSPDINVSRAASHGGRGYGILSTATIYGNVQQPSALGSAGSGQSSFGNTAGGGAIKLEATGTITINGTVSANGIAEAYYSCGSGGSIWLVADTLAGAGSIQAKGAQVAVSSGGGGGRIALVYTNSTFSGTVSAAGGRSLNDSSVDQLADAQAGSLWEPEKNFPTDNSHTQTDSYQYYFPAGSPTCNWTHLTVSNAWFEVHDGNVTVSNLTLIDSSFRFDDARRPYIGYSDMISFAIAGNVVLTNRTRYSQLHLPSGDYTVETLTVYSNGVVLAGGDPTATNAASGGTAGSPHGTGVTIRAGTVLVAAYGSINADKQGFYGATGPGYLSHGGLGYPDRSASKALYSTYGWADQPTALGGGNQYNASPSSGGGALRLIVDGTLTINGGISANGAVHAYSSPGGSVWLEAVTLAGTGAIRARGGTSEGGSWGAPMGGGGRIAIEATNSTFSGSICARGGYWSDTDPASIQARGRAQAGTLWFPKWIEGRRGTPGTPDALSVTNNNAFQYVLPDAQTNYWSLTVSNAWFELRGTNGNVALSGLALHNAVFRHDKLSQGQEMAPALGSFGLAGDLRLSGMYSYGYLCSAIYQFGDLTIGASNTLFVMSDTNVINEASGGVTNKRHGAGIVLSCSNATIHSLGTLSAGSAGFWMTGGPSGGNSHGGRGTSATATYGTLARPSALGGGYNSTASGRGGGAVKLVVANTLGLNGTVAANGGDGSYGSAGGSVWIVANTMSGSGTIMASGSKYDDWSGSGGGGGRVAIDAVSSSFSGNVLARQGYDQNNAYSATAKTGTVFRCKSVVFGSSAPDGTGPTMDTTYSVASNGVFVYRQASLWQAAGSLKWTDQSVDAGSNQFNNTATYTITNLPPNKDYYVFRDGVNIFGAGVTTNTGSSGSLRFPITLDAVREIEVQNANPIYAAGIQTMAASNVTANAAFMNGNLTVTGTPPTTVFVFWGTADGGTTPGAWQHGDSLGVVSAIQPVSTNMTVPTGSDYFYRYAASNEAGLAWSTNSAYFMAAGVTVSVEPAIIGEANESATFSVVRPLTATSRTVTVYYSIGGTASNGMDYLPLSATNIAIGAGATNATFTVTSIRDSESEGNETVDITLLPDSTTYPVGSPGLASLTITNTPTPTDNETVAVGMWTNPATWNCGFVPVANQNVTVKHSVTNPPGTYPAAGGPFGAFVVNIGVTVTCLGDTNAVNAASGGTVVSPHGIGVTIRCASALISGLLNANGQGFIAGPVGGQSHGGLGHTGSTPNNTAVYGNLREPTALGSGYNVIPTGGGGAIKLDASGGSITLNGTVTANGKTEYYTGAGGSLWLLCLNFAGTGTVSACGGDSTAGDRPVGGGGRVALVYTNSTFTGTVDVRGGRSTPFTYQAQPGTLWEPGRFTGRAGSPAAPQAIGIVSGYQYYFPDTSTTNYWNLTVSNAWVELHQGAVAVGDLAVTNGVLRYDRYSEYQPSTYWNRGLSDMALFDVTNRIVAGAASNRSTRVALCAGTYRLNAIAVLTNATLECLGDTNAINAASGGTSGKRHGAGVILACGNATINGTLSADAGGFTGNTGPSGGPSHGGVDTQARASYGSLTRPSALGGGRAAVSSGNGRGGGAVKLVVTNRLDLAGAVQANGTAADAGYGTAGGSVWIVANEMNGSGAIQADAAVYQDWAVGVGGGGGRVAIDTVTSTFNGSVSVRQGRDQNGVYSSTAKTGTVFRCRSLVFGSSTPDGAGPTMDATYGVSSNGVVITRSVTQWRDRFEWTDTTTDGYGNPLNNTATYAFTNLPPAKPYKVTIDGTVWLSRTNSGPLGILTLTGAILSPSSTVLVQSHEGTIFVMH